METKLTTKGGKDLQQMLNYINNNFQKRPFESKIIKKWCIDFRIANAQFYLLVGCGAVEKIDKGLYQLKEYTSTTVEKALEFQRATQKSNRDNKSIKDAANAAGLSAVPKPLAEALNINQSMRPFSSGHGSSVSSGGIEGKQKQNLIPLSIDGCIEFLKSKGYKVMKAVTTYEEL